MTHVDGKNGNGVAAFWIAASIALAACSESGPADPVWGKEPCGHCAMLVGDRAAAAQALDAHGTRRFFDDVGCLVAWTAEQGAPPQKAWVHAPHGWVDARTARFRAGAVTPMDSGYVWTEAGNGVDYPEMAREFLDRGARRPDAGRR